jgi:hypothetical protein
MLCLMLCLSVVDGHVWHGVAFALAGTAKKDDTLARPTRVEAAEDMVVPVSNA